MAPSKVFSHVEFRGRCYPMVPVAIKGKRVTKLYALVDSGAVISLFHTSIAEDAGIDLSDARVEYLAGIGGYVQAYVKDNVELEVEGLGELTLQIAFTEYISADLAILGRRGFFEHFEITFREWRKELEVKLRQTP